MGIVTAIKAMRKGLSLIPWRTVGPVVLVCLTVFWLIKGWGISKGVAVDSPIETARVLIEEYKETNPKLANDIARLQKEFGAQAVAIKLKVDAQRMAGTGADAQLLERQLDRGAVPYEIRLASLAKRSNLDLEPKALETFLDEYGTYCEAILEPEFLDVYLARIERLADNPRVWPVVREDIGAPVIWDAVEGDEELWAFFVREREWLRDPLFAIHALFDTAMKDGLAGEWDRSEPLLPLRDAIIAAKRFDPLVKLAVEEYKKLGDEEGEEEGAAIILGTFMHYGHTIESAVNDYGLPRYEVVAVLYANPGVFEPDSRIPEQDKASGFEQASYLREVYNEQQTVWQYALSSPLALKLYKDVPLYAQQLLERYGDHDEFVVLLYRDYVRDLEAAAQAIVKYEDLAIWVLGEYRDDERMHKFLADPEVGHRTVPFVMRFFPNGLDKLEHDKRFVNKYFDEEGKQLDDERWWEALPAGGVAKVAVNWANGKPCEWSELGWAAFDVVTLAPALLAAPVTGGQSLVLTTTARQTVKPGVKSAVRIGGKSLVKSSGKTLTKAGVKTMAKPAAKTLGKKGAKTVLRRYAGVMGRTTWGALKVGGKGTVKVAGKMGKGIKTVSKKTQAAWRALGPVGRRRALRIAAAGAIVYKAYARREALAKAPEQTGELLGRSLRAIGSGFSTALVAAAKEMLPVSGACLWQPGLVYALVLILLGGFTVYSLMHWRRTVKVRSL